MKTDDINVGESSVNDNKTVQKSEEEIKKELLSHLVLKNDGMITVNNGSVHHHDKSTTDSFDKVRARSKAELRSIIKKTTRHYGFNCNLNFIDTSELTDLSGVFFESPFNGDISAWDVSSVTDMSSLFEHCDFNGDISSWDVSSVIDMSSAFSNSRFKGDISKWDVSNVVKMAHMFDHCDFNGDISKWRTASVIQMSGMFEGSKFSGDISSWNTSNVKDMSVMFAYSSFNGKLFKSFPNKVTAVSDMFRLSSYTGSLPYAVNIRINMNLQNLQKLVLIEGSFIFFTMMMFSIMHINMDTVFEVIIGLATGFFFFTVYFILFKMRHPEW